MRFDELSIKPISYHNTLNTVLWENNHLKTDIRYKLLLIAKHFTQYLNVDNLNLKDITLSGSNASYGYSEYSDIDLHLVVDLDPDRVELYTAKKNLYNAKYDIKIKDIDVELYVQSDKQKHHSAGIYSILNDRWISEPKHEPPKVSEQEVKSKARNYAGKINSAFKSNDLDIAKSVLEDIYKLRAAGLESGGENSVENLAFKTLRNMGIIKALHDAYHHKQDQELSLK